MILTQVVISGPWDRAPRGPPCSAESLLVCPSPSASPVCRSFLESSLSLKQISKQIKSLKNKFSNQKSGLSMVGGHPEGYRSQGGRVLRSEDSVGQGRTAGPVVAGSPRPVAADPPRNSPPRCWARGLWGHASGQGSARDSLSLLCDTRASAGTSAGVAPGTETIQQLRAAATCRLLPSHARATATQCSAGTGPWILPCGLTVEPCFLTTRRLRLKRGHPEGKYLERRRPRKPDRRPVGLGDPASGARQRDLLSTVFDSSAVS